MLQEKPARNWLLHDHRAYEDVVSDLRACLPAALWEDARVKLGDLVSLLKGHFLMEEEVLFPAYEEIVGIREGTTRELRREHDLIRACLERFSRALEKHDRESTLDAMETLERVMAVHHEKEEEVFLPMAGHALLETRGEVMERLKRHDWKHAMKGWKV